MEKLSDQSRRLELVLMAKENYSMNCDKCPLKDDCLPWCEELAKQEIDPSPSITCETLLVHWIVHGEFLPNRW